METSGKPKSKNLSVNWYDVKIPEKERQMVQSLEIQRFKAQIQIPKWWREQFHWQRLDQLHLERKHQNKIPVLSEFLQQIIVHSSHSRTHRRRKDWTRNAGSRSHTSKMEGVWRSCRECRTHRRRARRSRNQTHSFLHTINPMVHRRRILWWSDDAQRSSVQNRLEARSKRCLLDPFLEGTRERDIVLANEIACNHHMQHDATWLHWTCDLTTR